MPPTTPARCGASFKSWSMPTGCSQQFRTGFLGKASPVHFFWGSFDLAVTRFSGRRAPRHPGGVPHLSDDVACEAYSHEVSSAGFWPGSGAIDYPAFYSYAYPEPAGFRATKVRPEAAFFSKDLGEFILPYDAVRTARRAGRRRCSNSCKAPTSRGGRFWEVGSRRARVRLGREGQGAGDVRRFGFATDARVKPAYDEVYDHLAPPNSGGR